MPNRRRWSLLILLGIAVFAVIWIPSLNPFVAIERLNAPVRVRSASETHLILEDSRAIPLRGMAQLPTRIPLFQAAVSSGVEVRPNGEVYGLVWVQASALVIPFWRKRPVNLAVLAAVLNPEGIDKSLTDKKTRDSFASNVRVESIRGFGNQYRYLIGFHWSWLNSIQDGMRDAPWLPRHGDVQEPTEH